MALTSALSSGMINCPSNVTRPALCNIIQGALPPSFCDAVLARALINCNKYKRGPFLRSIARARRAYVQAHLFFW